MILYEFLLKEVDSNKYSEINIIKEYLILSESITSEESKNLISIVEQMHQDVESQLKTKLEKALNILISKYNTKIKAAREAVAKARMHGYKPNRVKALTTEIDNLKQELQIKIGNLKLKHEKILSSIKKTANNSKALIKLKALGIKYPNAVIGGKLAVAGTAIGLTGYAANKYYKNYMTKAARMCAGKEGSEKSECIKRYKEMAKKAKLQ